MPYISQARRKYFDSYVNGLVNELHNTGTGYGTRDPGELNYVLTKIALGYLYQKRDGKIVHTPRYAEMNEVIGVLESVKSEFYRREVSPYEDEKALVVGDVYFGKKEEED